MNVKKKPKIVVVAPQQARGFAKQDKVIVIVGPTASGKSDLAIKMARHFNGEIISADSRQTYIGMNIGTGKVTKKERKLAKHHLIDIVSPKKEFNVSDFQKLGQAKIDEILSKNKLPIICGGTGFWVDALVYNTSLPNVPPNKKLRAKLEKQTAEQLFTKLKKLDPRRAKTIDPMNKHRLVRALEIILSTGRPVPITRPPRSKFDVLWLGTQWPKETLARRIKMRLDARIKQGMISEVERLISSGVSYKRLFEFGLEYRWVSRHIRKEITRKEMASGLCADIIKYSKRQMTWFKRNKNITWINPKRLSPAYGRVKRFLNL